MRYFTPLLLSILLCSSAYSQTANTPNNWCNHPLRKGFGKFTEIKTSHKWFKVYDIGDHIIAICEPYNFEEVISYLILGKSRALLFDTGMGFDSISAVVKQLTTLPVTVINSHTHFDHIGGNHEFKNVLAMDTDFTIGNAKNGYAHHDIKFELTPEALCLQRIPGFDTLHYFTKPFKITSFVKDGDEIDLGGRKLKIMSIPGHTPDAIALLDEAHGDLWSGDMFYEGPIYLLADETDLPAYEKSIAKLAKMVPKLKKVLPSHNTPVSQPQRLTELVNNFSKIRSGKIKGKDLGNNQISFQFQYFGFLVDKRKL